MNIHNFSNRNAPEQLAQNAAQNAAKKAAQTPPEKNTHLITAALPGTGKTASPLQAQTQSRAFSFPAFSAAAGLPADKLSASILSFARFFSLPIKPESMAEIRRNVFINAAAEQQSKTLTPAEESAPVLKQAAANSASSREALSLAAAAAEAKGAELQPKALEAYTQTIDPEFEKQRDAENQHRKHQKGQNEKEKSLSKTGHISASGIKELAMETGKKDPLLAIMNRLPCKNGQRWIVLPFSFCDHGREFKISLRILLEAENRVINMALDIAETGSKDKDRRWLFVLDDGHSVAPRHKVSHLSVYLKPEYTAKEISSLTHEMSVFFDIPPERIKIKNSNESILTDSSGADDFYSINEEA